MIDHIEIVPETSKPETMEIINPVEMENMEIRKTVGISSDELEELYSELEQYKCEIKSLKRQLMEVSEL